MRVSPATARGSGRRMVLLGAGASRSAVAPRRRLPRRSPKGVPAHARNGAEIGRPPESRTGRPPARIGVRAAIARGDEQGSIQIPVRDVVVSPGFYGLALAACGGDIGIGWLGPLGLGLARLTPSSRALPLGATALESRRSRFVSAIHGQMRRSAWGPLRKLIAGGIVALGVRAAGCSARSGSPGSGTGGGAGAGRGREQRGLPDSGWHASQRRVDRHDEVRDGGLPRRGHDAKRDGFVDGGDDPSQLGGRAWSLSVHDLAGVPRFAERSGRKLRHDEDQGAGRALFPRDPLPSGDESCAHRRRQGREIDARSGATRKSGRRWRPPHWPLSPASPLTSPSGGHALGNSEHGGAFETLPYPPEPPPAAPLEPTRRRRRHPCRRPADMCP